MYVFTFGPRKVNAVPAYISAATSFKSPCSMPLHLAVSILGVPSTISCSCPPLPRLPAPLCIPIQKWGGKRQRQKAPSSRSNSPSLRLPCRPSCSPISLNDASETRGRTRSGWRIWSAQHSNTEAEREREREGESGSFSRAALPKFKLKHRLLQFYIVSAVGRGLFHKPGLRRRP